MALFSGGTDTADSIETEYYSPTANNAAVRIRMHLDAVDGIAHDAVDGLKALPRTGVEVGGLLLGHVEPGDRPLVWIERYQRIECAHRYGPRFVLDEEEHSALDEAAGQIAAGGELSVVGFYRSHTRPRLHLDEPDHDIISRYFSDATDLFLLIKPENMRDITAQFFTRGISGERSLPGRHSRFGVGARPDRWPNRCIDK